MTRQSKGSEATGRKVDVLRIGNAGGYWGDDPAALRRQMEGPLQLDYISIDFLAEITMSILQKQMAKDPKAGYARDFVTQVSPLLQTMKEKGIRIITNAGGVNPRACAQALFEAAHKQGVSLRVAIVEGDNVQAQLGTIYENEKKAGQPALLNMDDGRDFAEIKDRVLSANAYFGSKPVLQALQHEPDIVLCGRVTDTGITLAALMHAFGWSEQDHNQLAHGIVAGHIIECGAQATGGNFTDWQKVPHFENIGFPIVECSADGSFVVTKHPGSGGLVNVQTIREQLLYEMGEPESYITPDVIADFSSIQLKSDGADRVAVSGVRGRKATDLLKLSISYEDGFKSSGALVLSGPDAVAKANCMAELFWKKLNSDLQFAGLSPLEHTRTERIGADSTHGPLSPSGVVSEVLLRLAARDHDINKLKIFRKVLPGMILSGPSGVAVTGGAPVISEIVSYWPALVPQHVAPASYVVMEASGSATPVEVASEENICWSETGGVAERSPSDDANQVPVDWEARRGEMPLKRVPLMQLAHARSGDKGDTANIGLIARSQAAFDYLQQTVTASFVKERFGEMCLGQVRRFSVPNLWSLNFLLDHSLDGGGTMSLHIDAQGKTYSQALLRVEVLVPEPVLESVSPEMRAPSGELSA